VFMGEEWAARTPWQFFASFPDPDLAEAVRSGRRAEFGRHGWGAADVPDPMDPATVARSRLDWSELEQPPHRAMLTLYQQLIALRRNRPELADPRLADLRVDAADSWLVLHRGSTRLACNLGDIPARVPLGGRPTETLLAWGDVAVAGDEAVLPPASFVLVSVGVADLS
jgi:maltooligosyltrehalose trehalohydrolase